MAANSNILAIAKQVFLDEINGLNQVSKALGDSFCAAIDLIYECKGKVIVSGIGKSGHIGHKIAATLASTGTAAFFMHPAEALHGDLGMIGADDILIAISYSGEADELNWIIPIIKRKKVPVIGISGNHNSTLAKLSDCVLTILVDKEACPLNLAPTTSTTATLVLGDALAVTLLSLRDFKPADFALSHPGGSLGRKLLTKVGDIMHTGDELPLIPHDASLKNAVMEISKKGLGFVAVIDNEQKLCGIITDGDLRRILDNDIDIRKLFAREVMALKPKVMMADDMAVDAAALMNKHKITGVLVVNSDYEVIGAFNMHDLFKAKLI